MADCRDWLKTMWRASYKGVPFWFEADKEEGGRGLVIHEFPNRDDPFVEDLGEATRYFSGSAYVASDAADAEAVALKAVLASRGPGILVTPYFGPVTVHCQTFERSTERDRAGFVAFDLKFVRAGATTAFVSLPYLQTQAYAAIDDLVRLVGETFPLSLILTDRQEIKLAPISDTLASAAAVLDMLRQSYPVAPAVSAKLRNTLSVFVATAAEAVNQSAARAAGEREAEVLFGVADPLSAAIVTLASAVRDFAAGLSPDLAERAVLELAAAFEPSAAGPLLAPSQRIAAANEAAAARMVRLAALAGYADTVLRRTFSSRHEGVTARGEVAERFEAEAYDTDGAENVDLFRAIEALRGLVADWLTQSINDLAPVIAVEVPSILPSLALAWTLYGDPARAGELVKRNGVRHPSFMPREITALAR